MYTRTTSNPEVNGTQSTVTIELEDTSPGTYIETVPYGHTHPRRSKRTRRPPNRYAP